MSGRVSPLYEYRELASARQSLDGMADSHPRFQHLYEALIWVVLRDPFRGMPVTGGGEFVVRSLDFLASGLPDILVVYCLQEPKIVEVLDVLRAAQNGND